MTWAYEETKIELTAEQKQKYERINILRWEILERLYEFEELFKNEMEVFPTLERESDSWVCSSEALGCFTVILEVGERIINEARPKLKMLKLPHEGQTEKLARKRRFRPRKD